MEGTPPRSWQVLLLDPKGKVLGGRRLEASVWLEAVRDFAGYAGEPLGRGGLICSIQADGSFLVYESQVARVFLARPEITVDEQADLPEGRTSTIRGMGALGAASPPDQEAPVAPAGPPQDRKGSLDVDRPELRPSKPGGPVPAAEPAVVVDPALVKEMSRLEQMARWTEVSEDKAEELLPHRVLWCKQKVDEAQKPVVRCALAVWPDPPRHALEKLVTAHATGLRDQLELKGQSIKVVVAAFDHAFHKVPVRPALAAAVWPAGSGEEPTVLMGDEASGAWPIPVGKTTGMGFRTAGDSGTVMVPAVKLKGGVVTQSQPEPGRKAGDEPESHIPTAVVPAQQIPQKAKTKAVREPEPEPAPAPAAPPEPAKEEPAVQPPAPGEPGERSGPRTESLLFLAFDALHQIYAAETRPQAVSLVLDTMVNLVPAQAGAIYLYDESLQALRLEAFKPTDTKADPVRVDMGQGLVGACAQQGVALALTEVHRDARFGSVLAEKVGIKPESLLGAPVEHQGRLFGAVELVNRKGREGFSGGEVEAIAYAARMLAERLSVLPTKKK
jgi:hypothetical protein